jgi:hypothetical protein
MISSFYISTVIDNVLIFFSPLIQSWLSILKFEKTLNR